MKRLLFLLLVCPSMFCCQEPTLSGESEPSLQDQGTQFAPETASMTETAPSQSYDNWGVSEPSSSSGDSCWGSYDR